LHGGLLLVQALEIAVVPLVQRLVANDGRVLPECVAQDLERLLRAGEHRCIRHMEAVAVQEVARDPSFVFAGRRERDVDPAREPVLEVPLRLPVPHQYQQRHATSV
jgi:hypothetical protein